VPDVQEKYKLQIYHYFETPKDMAEFIEGRVRTGTGVEAIRKGGQRCAAMGAGPGGILTIDQYVLQQEPVPWPWVDILEIRVCGDGHTYRLRERLFGWM
jgi:L-fucose isomerase-like protein